MLLFQIFLSFIYYELIVIFECLQMFPFEYEIREIDIGEWNSSFCDLTLFLFFVFTLLDFVCFISLFTFFVTFLNSNPKMTIPRTLKERKDLLHEHLNLGHVRREEQKNHHE